MWKILLERAKQGHRTAAYPDAPPTLPDRFRGAPKLDAAKCPDGCRSCADACPTDPLSSHRTPLPPDAPPPAASRAAWAGGRCFSPPDCPGACPAGAIAFTGEHRLAARHKDDLVVTGELGPRERALDEKLRRLFGRSLKLRQVSAG